MEDLKEFRKKVLKVTGKRVHKITNSAGVREAYRWLKKNKMITSNESEFYKIVSTVHKEAIKDLSEGKEFKFPYRMGKLEVRQADTYIKFEEGKVKTNRAIDWGETLKLWHEDEEALQNKTLVRKERNVRYFIFYNKRNTNYENCTFMRFRPNRSFHSIVAHSIENNNISTYKI